ncbi:MAG TPA: hypothetical protein VKB59_16590 [Micromonosporaceae bacterium]|nr:hypothetical protein [Micromonosporaceae bacterium]
MSTIEMSLGSIADILWRKTPELRIRLAEMAADDLRYSAERNSDVIIVSPFELCTLFRVDIMDPAMRDGNMQMLRRSLEVIEEILALGPVPHEIYANALFHSVIDHIYPTADPEILHAANPAAFQAMKDAYGLDRW